MSKTIYVIEDDTSIRENILFILGKEGFSTLSNKTGENVTDDILNNSVDIILCDVMLPEKSGFDILAELRSELPAKKVPPFLFLTAVADRKDVRRGMELGADDYLTKPFTRKELLSAIDTQIKKREEFTHQTDVEKEIMHIIESNVKNLASNEDEKKLENSSLIRVEQRDTIRFIKVADIIMIESDRDYSKIFTSGNESFLMRRTMRSWESSLPNQNFLRVHRSIIINMEYILKFEKTPNNCYKVFLNGIEKPVMVSQRYSRFLRKIK